MAANLAVVACARYEIALPLARDDAEARALVALCRRILLAVHRRCARRWRGGLGAVTSAQLWPLWLPAAVGALGLAVAGHAGGDARAALRRAGRRRVLQHGGGAALQAAAGAAGAGAGGLIVAPIAAALAAAAWLGRASRRPARCRAAALAAAARRHRDFPLLNTPHAFLGALQDTLAVALIAAWQGPAAAGFWGLALRYLKAPATLVGGAVSQALYPALAAGGAASEARPRRRAPRAAHAAAAGAAAGAGAVAVRRRRPLPRPSANAGARPANWRARWRCTSACTSWPRRCRW